MLNRSPGWLLLLLLLAVPGCVEGPEGPMGPPGPQGDQGEPGPIGPGQPGNLLRVLGWSTGDEPIASRDERHAIPGLAQIDPETEIVNYFAWTFLAFEGDDPEESWAVELPTIVRDRNGNLVQASAVLGTDHVRLIELEGFFVIVTVYVFSRP